MSITLEVDIQAFQVLHLQSDEELLRRNGSEPLTKEQFRLRQIIPNLWKSKVTLSKYSSQKDGKRVPAFNNLRKKDFNSVARSAFGDSPASEHFIQVPGWQVVINNDKSLSILRIEDWLLDGQRVVMEIPADQVENSTQYKYILSMHGHKLDINDLGLNVGQLFSPKLELELLAKYFSGAQLCKGFNPPDTGTSNCTALKIAEYSAASDFTMAETRIFSGSCQIFCFSKLLCSECKRCQEVLVKKLQRRHVGKVSVHHNHRYMTREQLVSKLKDLQKELYHYKMKVKQLENKDKEVDGDGGSDGDSDGDNDKSDCEDDSDKSDGSGNVSEGSNDDDDDANENDDDTNTGIDN